MKKDWEPLELLRHSRHDWLNHIQLIKANLSLNRLDRVREIIEEVTAQSHNESKLTNLHIPKVAEMLLTFNWDQHAYLLQVEVVGQERDLSHVQNPLFDSLVSLFQSLDRSVDMTTENHVSLTFDLKEESVALNIDVTGRLTDQERFQRGLDLHKWFPTVEQYVSEEEFVLTVKLV